MQGLEGGVLDGGADVARAQRAGGGAAAQQETRTEEQRHQDGEDGDPGARHRSLPAPRAEVSASGRWKRAMAAWCPAGSAPGWPARPGPSRGSRAARTRRRARRAARAASRAGVRPAHGDRDGEERRAAAEEQPGDRARRGQPAPPDAEDEQRAEGGGGHGEGHAHRVGHRQPADQQRTGERHGDGEDGGEPEVAHAARGQHVLGEHPGDGHGQPGGGGQERGERPARDQRAQQIAAEPADDPVGQQQDGRVGVCPVRQLGGVQPAERPVDGRQQIEEADQGEDGDGGAAGGAAVGAGVEADDDVRQAHGAEEGRQDQSVRRVQRVVGAEDGELVVEADPGPAVALPGEDEEEGGDQQRGELQPVLEGLDEGDAAHAAGRHGHHHHGATRTPPSQPGAPVRIFSVSPAPWSWGTR